MAGDPVGPTGGDEPDEAPPTLPLSSVAPVPAAEPAVPAAPSAPSIPAYGAPSYGAPGYGPLGYASAGYSPAPGMRASAADRDRTIDVLKAAYGEGRLGRDEFEHRAGRTMSARTYGELAAIVADLPAGPLGPSGLGYYPAGPSAPTNGMAAGSLACSLAGMVFPLMLVPGIVLGHVAREQIRGTDQRGDGFAIAGLVLGYVGLALWALIITLLVNGAW